MAITREFRVHSITDAGSGNLLVGFTDLGINATGTNVPTYGTTTSGVTLLLQKTEAAGIVPGDTYTVSFTVKA